MLKGMNPINHPTGICQFFVGFFFIGNPQTVHFKHSRNSRVEVLGLLCMPFRSDSNLGGADYVALARAAETAMMPSGSGDERTDAEYKLGLT